MTRKKIDTEKMNFVKMQFTKALGGVWENHPTFPKGEPQDVAEAWGNLMIALRDFINCTHNYD